MLHLVPYVCVAWSFFLDHLAKTCVWSYSQESEQLWMERNIGRTALTLERNPKFHWNQFCSEIESKKGKSFKISAPNNIFGFFIAIISHFWYGWAFLNNLVCCLFSRWCNGSTTVLRSLNRSCATDFCSVDSHCPCPFGSLMTTRTPTKPPRRRSVLWMTFGLVPGLVFITAN